MGVGVGVGEGGAFKEMYRTETLCEGLPHEREASAQCAIQSTVCGCSYVHCLHRGVSLTGGRDDPDKVGVVL